MVLFKAICREIIFLIRIVVSNGSDMLPDININRNLH